tara:strand:+ start:216 stop:419 length:204 start_codon:yes stop_codon:yes gene_type:complete
MTYYGDCDSYVKNFRLLNITVVSSYGAIAQLVEHLHGMQGVRDSSSLGSISFFSVIAIDFRDDFVKI